jgi:hypothetical protein
MRGLLFLLVLALATVGWCQAQQSATGATPSKREFDGKWWSRTDAEERAGFLSGSADCLTEAAHAKWLTYSVQGLDAKITKYYKDNPLDGQMSVADVWRKVLEQSHPTKSPPGGEVWTNPHGFFNGDWWCQVSEAQQLGFVEGYLWCMRTQVPAPTETYSGSASFYRRKIDAFVRANPKYGLEAVAITLRRYQDKDAPAVPK